MNWYWQIKIAAIDELLDKQLEKARPYTPDEWGVDKAYQSYQQTYQKATGKAWTPEKFRDEASAWTFYGDDQRTGYITIKNQGQFVKLTTLAGSLKGAMIGLRKLLSENRPVWGMTSAQLVPIFSRVGMVPVDSRTSRCVVNRIQPFYFSSPATISADGAVTINYSDVGAATKYLIVNSQMQSYVNGFSCGNV
jgi:hypothetical protein